MNNVNLIGRLAADPELRTTKSGTAVANLRVAVPRRKGKDGEDRGAAFIDVIAWSKQAELASEYLAKGRRIAVAGRLDQEEWQAEDGTNRSRVVIVAEDIDYLERPKGEGGDQE